ncbi:radical SAM family protein [Enterococcus diestrammenae]|uniref:hypothetical protein n=1 Tax=Enterococcus diestrammenae TaxID=1155073 RepID=UPI00195B2DF9
MANILELGKIAVGPSQISFDITYRCNFRCKHCYNASGLENCFIEKGDEIQSYLHESNFIKEAYVI